MNRRIGQTGSVELRNGAYRGRYLVDIPGQQERRKVSVVIGWAKDMSKSEARRRLKGIIAATGIDLPSYKIPSALCFSKHVDAWEQTYLIRMKPSNQKNMHYHLDTYLLPKWGSTAVDFITAERVNEWLGGPELQHLAPATVRGIIRTLQLALGVHFGKRKIHYASSVNEETETRCYGAPEIAAILTGATGQYKALFTLAAETGMRAGEYGLRVEDIDFTRSVVHVRRSMWNGMTQTPKNTRARRVIDVQPYVTEMLKEHLAGRETGLLFASKRGTPLRNESVLNRHLYPLLRRLKLQQGGMHAFRHFRVSFLVENGTPIELIKLWIGHGSEEMIRRYTHLHPTYCKDVLAKMPAVAPVAPQSAAA